MLKLYKTVTCKSKVVVVQVLRTSVHKNEIDPKAFFVLFNNK